MTRVQLPESKEVRSPGLEGDVEAFAGEFVTGALEAVLAESVGQAPGASAEVSPGQLYAAFGAGRREVDGDQMSRVGA